jgi:hypothetical protein
VIYACIICFDKLHVRFESMYRASNHKICQSVICSYFANNMTSIRYSHFLLFNVVPFLYYSLLGYSTLQYKAHKLVRMRRLFEITYCLQIHVTKGR